MKKLSLSSIVMLTLCMLHSCQDSRITLGMAKKMPNYANGPYPVLPSQDQTSSSSLVAIPSPLPQGYLAYFYLLMSQAQVPDSTSSSSLACPYPVLPQDQTSSSSSGFSPLPYGAKKRENRRPADETCATSEERPCKRRCVG